VIGGETSVQDPSATPSESELHVESLLSRKRTISGLSRRELGRRCGLSVAYVSALESGRIAPSLRAFARLAAELRFTDPELQMVMAIEAERPLKGVAVSPPADNGVL
jgi:transcriptional regulator with XRE-family HTH domain